jgi:HAT1-interacting factor 1
VLDHAKRAFALRKFEQAVQHYATALELLCVPFVPSFPPTYPLIVSYYIVSYRRSTTHAEDAPEMADVYFAYGKALLENAIVQNSVLGKEQEGGATAEEGMCCVH